MTETAPSQHAVELPPTRPKAETPFIIFCSFLSTFVAARIVVAGLYGGWWKLGGFLYVAGFHIHHYNYRGLPRIGNAAYPHARREADRHERSVRHLAAM